MQIPRPSLALDLHFACYATPYTNGITHGGEVQAPRALVALDLRVICYATSYIEHRRVEQPRDPNRYRCGTAGLQSSATQHICIGYRRVIQLRDPAYM